MTFENFYVASKKGEIIGPSRPEELLQRQIHAMLGEVAEYGCSKPRLAPINGAKFLLYQSLGEKITLDEVVDYPPLEVIESTLITATGVDAVKRYDRTFTPGEGEGTHNDPHDIVITYTVSGTADFTIDAEEQYRSHKLGAHHLIAFNARLLHEVSAPHTGGHRTIAAFGVDL